MTLDLPLLLLQLLVILVAARAFGAALRRAGQPRVVGEMVAGIALGPSLLGSVAPSAFGRLFPAAAMPPLAALSQVGVLLFLFAVGLRLDLGSLRAKARAAAATSLASVAAPFALGAALGAWLYPRLAGPSASGLAFALFLGAAMSVTAFPVLARILVERGLLGTRVGALAIACAAVDDVTAWCVLAVVVAVARGESAAAGPLLSLAGVFAVVAGTLLVLRPLLARALAPSRASDEGTGPPLAAAVVVALSLALVTEWAGVHALFGAFLAGAALPREGGVAAAVAERIEGVVGVVLLPVFFAYTGLRTSLALIDDGGLWALTGLVVAVAVAGKLGASALAARASGSPWREALALGALLNTRGLMELVILGVGLDIGVVSPPLFAIMVTMAIVTTLMTGPLLTLAGLRAPGVDRGAVPRRAAA